MYSKALQAIAPFILLTMFGGVSARVVAAKEPLPTVYLEEMTSPELHERVLAGVTTVLIPIGGTEQSGAHMVLGKHNVRVKALAGMIARELGNAIVAPVVAYVPEGDIHPPTSHMRFPGTISIPVSAFESLLEGAARSFKQHGFHRIIFLGDHGGYQKIIGKTARQLNQEWASDPSCRVYALSEYYQAGQTTFAEDLKARGFNEAQIGVHAGLLDTSLALAIDPKLVRVDQLGGNKKPSEQEGVRGDPRAATEELGEIGVKRIVEASVQAIRKLPPLDSAPFRNPGSSKKNLDPSR